MTVDYRTGEITESLSSIERLALVDAEEKIARGIRTFIEVGEALANVRDQGLYRGTHTTFEAYCSERWGITDRRARQMIDAAQVVSSLPTGTMVPVNERQARQLVGLDPERAADAMREADRATGGHPTANAIRVARDRFSARPAPAATVDVEQAVAEFPEVAYYADLGDEQRAVNIAGDLRNYREAGELDDRLATLRRSIEIDKSKRDGTYSPPAMPKVCHACGQLVSKD